MNMRITNKMMTNNMMNNINRNKNLLSKLDEQYSTGKKIQRPSEDPIVAVRALKLRTNLSELNQYYEKNIPDARSWMDVTEEAMKNMNDILTKINSSCVQGATDSLTASDRDSIAKTLEEMKKQIYQEGNANYAGRYVFTGYKTDTTMSFEENTTLKYSITEGFTGENIDALTKVGTYNPETDTPPVLNTHRIRLSYGTLDGVDPEIAINGADVTGAPNNFTITRVTSADANAYVAGPDEIKYITDTGEMVLGDNVYSAMKASSDISVTYEKSKFVQGDLRPEHYFECTDKSSDPDTTKYVNYTQKDQQIQYEINFNQKLTVNTQGKDAFDHEIGRTIDEILTAVNDVKSVEDSIAEVEKQLEDKSLTQTQLDTLNAKLVNLKTEFKLKTDIMQSKFNSGIKGSKGAQDQLNAAVADLGTRSVRLDLTEDRLSSQQVDFEELMSNNEDADIAETYIKMNSAETIYTASLNAAGKVVRSNLLDFL
jgi:flagellar hook-associated protein 3 FlgL